MDGGAWGEERVEGGAWEAELGRWSLVTVKCWRRSVGSGAWAVEHGTWRLGGGAWRMERGRWY